MRRTISALAFSAEQGRGGNQKHYALLKQIHSTPLVVFDVSSMAQVAGWMSVSLRTGGLGSIWAANGRESEAALVRLSGVAFTRRVI